MAKKYSLIHPLFMSFYSKDLYRDVAQNWQGICLVYLMALLAICIIPGTMKVKLVFSEYLNEQAPDIVRQVPDITISKGSVSINREEPYYILDKKTGEALMIIDTTGQVTSLDNTSARVLLTKNALIVKKDETATQKFDLAGIDSYYIDRTRVYKFIEDFESWFVFLLYPFALFFSLLYHLLLILLYAAIGILFSRVLRVFLGYRVLIRLAVISVTPVVILDSLLIIFNMVIPYWWLIGSLMSAWYLFFAVKANAEL